jgi:hypothetical protein
MRILVALSLMAVVFAGCVGDDSEIVDAVSNIVYESLVATAGQSAAHPMYNYPTNAELPVAENQTRVEVDGQVQWFRPVGRDLPSQPETVEPLTRVEGTGTAGGIAIFGPLAVYGQRGNSSPDMTIVDISDPMNPIVTARAEETPVRDADFIAYPDGRLVVISTAGGGSQYVTDVTDPYNPVFVTAFETPHGNHNIAVVPGTPLVYNSGSAGTIDIVDYTNPAEPVVVGEFVNGDGCHDITFYITNETQRAYCAAYPESEIWDITDPVVPVMVIEIPYPSIDKGIPGAGALSPVPNDDATQFPLSFSHLVMVNHDASILIVGDETGGGSINGCDVYATAAGTTVSGPVGNLWFYDITDETNPVLLGHVSPEAFDDPADPAGSCTAHFGRLLEDTGYLVMGFYTSGVVLIDFNDAANPVIVDRLVQEGSDIWDVQYHQGYLFTGDIGRGMDVLEIN